MKPLFACIVGMMIGSIVLLSSAFYKPHDLSLFQLQRASIVTLDPM